MWRSNGWNIMCSFISFFHNIDPVNQELITLYYSRQIIMEVCYWTYLWYSNSICNVWNSVLGGSRKHWVLSLQFLVSSKIHAKAYEFLSRKNRGTQHICLWLIPIQCFFISLYGSPLGLKSFLFGTALVLYSLWARWCS